MSLNVASIKQRLSKLAQYIEELKRHRSATAENLKADITTRLAVERAFQAAIESCIDIASHVVFTYRLGSPQEQRELFELLAQAGYLDSTFAATMGSLVGFRNRLVHLYWDVDPERLHEYLQTDVVHLERFRDFALQLIAAEGEGAG